MDLLGTERVIYIHKKKTVPEALKINWPRTINLNHTIWKWPTSQIVSIRMTSHFPRITTPPGNVSFHPFGFPINQKGWGTNVGPNIGQLSNWARMAWATWPRKKPNFDEAGDRRTVAKITGAARYKKRSMHKKENTLKTLERATPTLRPCFHLVLAFELIDLVL